MVKVLKREKNLLKEIVLFSIFQILVRFILICSMKVGVKMMQKLLLLSIV